MHAGYKGRWLSDDNIGKGKNANPKGSAAKNDKDSKSSFKVRSMSLIISSTHSKTLLINPTTSSASLKSRTGR